MSKRKVHQFHDKSQKSLFSHPTMVKDLLKGFVDEKFVNDIDYGQVEKVNVSYVSKQYQATESDLLLKLNIKGRETYLYLLIELQSTVDKFIVLRALSYMLSFYGDLLKQKKGKIDKFPPVFPIVLYTGTDTYTAPTHIEDLIDHWEITDYIPKFKCYKIAVNEGKEKQDELISTDNVAAAFFKLISAKTVEELFVVINELCRIVKSSELEREIVNFIKHLMIRLNIKIDDFPFEEGGLEMLETLVKKIKEDGVEEGIRRGREEGKFEGKLEGLEEVAKNAYKKGQSIEFISEITGLPIEKLKQILN